MSRLGREGTKGEGVETEENGGSRDRSSATRARSLRHGQVGRDFAFGSSFRPDDGSSGAIRRALDSLVFRTSSTYPRALRPNYMYIRAAHLQFRHSYISERNARIARIQSGLLGLGRAQSAVIGMNGRTRREDGQLHVLSLSPSLDTCI